MIENLKIALRKQQKLIALFLLTIVLPSSLLSIFGIRAIRNEHLRLIQQVEIEQRQAADLCKLQVRSRVKAVEDLLRRLAQDTIFAKGDEEAKRRSLRDHLAEDRLIELVYLVYTDEDPVYPLFQPNAAGRPSGVGPFFGTVDRLRVKKAEDYEFVQNDCAAAVTIYEEILRGTLGKDQRALVMAHRARNLSKLREYHRAITVYSKIQTEYPKSRTTSGTPLALIAQLEKARCYQLLGEPVNSLQAALEVYGVIVHNAWGLGESQFTTYASLGEEAVAGALSAGGAEVREGEDYRQRFEQLKAEHQVRIDTWEAITVLERESLPELQRQCEESGYSDSPLHHVSTIDGKEILLTAVMIPDGSKRSAMGILGVALSDVYLEGELLNEIAMEMGLGESSTLTVSTLSGRVLRGDSMVSERSVATTTFFEDSYPPWKLELTDHEVQRSGFPEIHKSFYFWTILTLVVVLIFGVVLVARTVGHEMELLKIKSDFVSSVSHEFKTPLTSIKALTERLMDGKVRQPGKMKEYFAIIAQDTDRLTRLVENLLDFARLDEGRTEFELVDTDIGRWMKETVDEFKHAGIGQRLDIRWHMPDATARANIDRAAMVQAVGNLLDNALKFSPESNRVDLTVETDNSRVYLRFKDYGIGIAEDEQAKVFEKFYQGKAPPKHARRGTGLGLTLVKHIVEAHGGAVTVESQLGEGSTFTVELPIQENTV